MQAETHIPPADYEREHPVLANPGETRSLEHLPQLDGVRAIAVLTVIWHHFAPINPGSLGAVGVGLFFTLSGFLITRILLNCRLKIAANASTVGQMLRQFYVRRFLRIFPLYYGVLAILFVVNYTSIRARIGWHVAYLSNVYFSFINLTAHGHGAPGERHLWSLSVEEQFYLIWPFIILLIPRRALLPAILLTICIGPAWRVLFQTHEIHWGLKHSLADQWMMPGCLDLLGLGALLALASLPAFHLTRLRRPLVWIGGIIGVPTLLAYIIATGLSKLPEFYDPTPYLPTALAGVWLIGLTSRGIPGPIGKLLQSPPLVYTGRISYGLYVIHMFVPRLLDWATPYLHLPEMNAWTRGGISFVISFMLATLSWFLYEAPLNRLKRYFEYDRTAATKPAISN